MTAFLTGSHVYGRPDSDSDVDLCVYMPDVVRREVIINAADDGCSLLDYQTGLSLRFGKLNLIVFEDEDEFKAWRNGTDELEYMAKLSENGYVTREKAVEILDEHVLCGREFLTPLATC